MKINVKMCQNHFYQSYSNELNLSSTHSYVIGEKLDFGNIIVDIIWIYILVT